MYELFNVRMFFILNCIKCELHVWSGVPALFSYKSHSVAGVIARKDEIIQEQEEIIRQREEDLQSLLDQISQREKQIKDLTGRYTTMILDWLQSLKQFYINVVILLYLKPV